MRKKAIFSQNEKIEFYVIGFLSLLFFGAISWMTFRQYAVFHLQAPDVVLFSQSMWNTLQGDFLYSSLTGKTILAHHFTPFFSFIAPVLWIWEDPRALFLMQTAALTLCGLILWRISKQVLPKWAIPMTALYFLNAALHEVAVQELRRIPFAAPLIALALYGLVKNKLWPISLGLLGAILVKEDMGLLIMTFGLFSMFFLKRWKFGSVLLVVGLVGTALLTLCLIPSFELIDQGWGCYPSEYDQLNYFLEADGFESDSSGGFLTRIGSVLPLNPIALLGRIFDHAGILALIRILLPVAIILPFLGWEWTLLAVPSVAAMMLSTNPQLHALKDWYMAPIIPILMVATTFGLRRIKPSWQPWMMGVLVSTTIGAYIFYSPLPGGRFFNPIRYQITDHHRVAHELLTTIPDDASVMAQDAFTQHLSMRSELHHLRWGSWNNDNFEYLVLDRKLRHYPFTEEEINNIIDERIADPKLTIVAEADGMFLFQSTKNFKGNNRPVGKASEGYLAVSEGAIGLQTAELSVADGRGIFHAPVSRFELIVEPSKEIRVTVYWMALDSMSKNRTVSVRLADETGWLIAQHDGTPSNGRRPTSAWEEGWYFRDVYYLTIPEGASPGVYTLSLLLYDSADLTPVYLDGKLRLDLAQVTIQ